MIGSMVQTLIQGRMSFVSKKKVPEGTQKKAPEGATC